MSVEKWFEDNWLVRRVLSVCRRWRKAFVHLYLYAVLIYLPLIVLRLTNFLDGMWDQDDHLAGAAELRIGRWFWPWLDRMRFGISLDPLPAIVSIALFTLGVLTIINLMRKPEQAARACTEAEAASASVNQAAVQQESSAGCGTCGIPVKQNHILESGGSRSPSDFAESGAVHLSVTEYLAGALMLTTPAILSQLSYSYMSITFGMAFLLSVCAVWVIAAPCEMTAEKACGIEKGPADGHKESCSLAMFRQIGWIALSSLLIALMMGLYQACLGVLCITALAHFIFRLDATCGGKDCCIRKGLWFALRMFLALVIGAILYEVLLQIHLTVMGETLSDYKGAASASLSGMISMLPSSIRHCWSACKAYFIDNLFTFNAFEGSRWFYLLYLVPALSAVFYAIHLLRSGSGAAGKFLLLILAGLLIPVFANSFFLLATDSDTAVQMTGGMSLILPLLLLTWDHVELPWPDPVIASSETTAGKPMENAEPFPSEEMTGPKSSVNSPCSEDATAAGAMAAAASAAQEEGDTSPREMSSPRRNRAAGILRIAVALDGILLLYGSIGQAGIDQYAMYVGRQATTTLAKSVLNEFAVYGVDYEYNVVMVYGAPADSPTFAVGDLYWEANLYAQYGNWGNEEETNRLCWGHFFDQQLRVSMNYAEDETLHAVMTSDQVSAMAVFPASGSVQNIWGVTVVKVAE